MAHLETESEFEALDDMRTLKNAAEINADPKRLKAAEKMAAKEIKALSKVSGTLLTGKKGKTLLA